MVLGDLAEGDHFAAARIGEQHIDLCVLLLDGVIKPVDIGEISHVAPHRSDPAADLLHGGIQCLLPAAGDKYRSTLGCKGFRRGETDTAGSTRHHHDLVVEPVRHRLSSKIGEVPLLSNMEDER